MEIMNFYIIGVNTIFTFSLPKDIFFKLFKEFEEFSTEPFKVYINDEKFQINLHNYLQNIILEENYSYKDDNYKAIYAIFKFFKKTLNYYDFFSVFINEKKENNYMYIAQMFIKICQFKLKGKEIMDLFTSNEKILKVGKDIDSIYITTQAKDSIGETNKDLRICRFCSQSGKKYFKHKSHAIPEAVGNKIVVSLEECDLCNEKFGKTIERDFIYFFDFFRVLNKQVLKKGGISQIHGINYKLYFDNIGDKDTLILLDKGLESKNGVIQLKHNQKVNLKNMYKALCKFSIGTIDNKKLYLFKKTIEWINGHYSDEKLPAIKICYNSPLYTKQPIFLHHMKKDNVDAKFPELLSVITFYNITILFIVPTFEEEIDLNFLNSNNFTNIFSQFNNFQWQTIKFDKMIDEYIYPTLNIKTNKKI